MKRRSPLNVSFVIPALHQNKNKLISKIVPNSTWHHLYSVCIYFQPIIQEILLEQILDGINSRNVMLNVPQGIITKEYQRRSKNSVSA